MRCEEFADLIDLFVGGELADEARERLEKHLFRCAECAHLVRGQERTRQLLREAFREEESTPGFRERASAKLHESLAEYVSEPCVPLNQWALPFPDET